MTQMPEPEPLFVMLQGSIAAQAFSAFNFQEWEGHVRRIAEEVIEAEPFPETRAKCGCGFEVSCHDGQRAQLIMSDHQCFYPPTGVSLPSPWHVSFSRMLTNVAGWSAIAFVLYTLIVRLLEP